MFVCACSLASTNQVVDMHRVVLLHVLGASWLKYYMHAFNLFGGNVAGNKRLVLARIICTFAWWTALASLEGSAAGETFS